MNIYDINIYYNGDEEFPSNIFNSELRKYYLDNQQYAENILAICNEIKSSGSKYSDNVSYYSSRYLHYNDSTYKCKNQDSVFSHIILEFKVKSIVGLVLGSKITARFGWLS